MLFGVKVMENRDLSLPVARAGPWFSWPSSSDCLAQSRPRVTPRPPPVTRCPPAHTHGDTAARLRPSRAWPIHSQIFLPRYNMLKYFYPQPTIKVLWNIFKAPAPGNCWRCWIINGDSLILLYRLTYGAVLYLIVAIKNIDRKISTSRF